MTLARRLVLASLVPAVLLLGVVVSRQMMCSSAAMLGIGGQALWTLCIETTTSDEAEADIFRRLAHSPAEQRFARIRYLRESLLAELHQGANDVVLSGIVEALAVLGGDDASNALLAMFWGGAESEHLRYQSVIAARGLAMLEGSPLEAEIPGSVAELYRTFAISNFARTPEEARAGRERFSELAHAVRRAFGPAED